MFEDHALESLVQLVAMSTGREFTIGDTKVGLEDLHLAWGETIAGSPVEFSAEINRSGAFELDVTMSWGDGDVEETETIFSADYRLVSANAIRDRLDRFRRNLALRGAMAARGSRLSEPTRAARLSSTAALLLGDKWPTG